MRFSKKLLTFSFILNILGQKVFLLFRFHQVSLYPFFLSENHSWCRRNSNYLAPKYVSLISFHFMTCPFNFYFHIFLTLSRQLMLFYFRKSFALTSIRNILVQKLFHLNNFHFDFKSPANFYLTITFFFSLTSVV